MNSTLPTPPIDLSRLLAEVERHDNAATKGPWGCTVIGDQGGIFVGPEGATPDETLELHVCELPGTWFHGKDGCNCVHDADFIAFARTALPQLAAIVGQLQRERDLAVAHDTQPYPTAWAYEQTCKVLNEKREQIKLLTAELTTLRTQLSSAQQRVEELEGQLSNRITS